MKWLSIGDEFTRERLVLKVGRGMTSSYAIDTLAELLSMRGVPNAIRSDDGPEVVAKAIQSWLAKVGVQTLYIEPGSPWQSRSDGVGRSAKGQSSGELSSPAAGRVSEAGRV